MTQQALELDARTRFRLRESRPHLRPAAPDRRVVQPYARPVLKMSPDRLAVFSYVARHVDQARAEDSQTKILPAADVKLQILKTVIERLNRDDRYVYIGMDHFARTRRRTRRGARNKQLQRNFQGYSTRAGSDIYASACPASRRFPTPTGRTKKSSGCGRLPWTLAARRCTRRISFPRRINRRRETIMRTMCDLSLDFAAMSTRLGITSPNISPPNSHPSHLSRRMGS